MIDIDLLLVYGACFKKVAKNEIIFSEGGTCNFYYQVVHGQVSWVNINEDGKEFIQAFASQGDCIGELSLFDDEPYAASAVAITDALLIRLHKPIFQKLICDYPAIHLKFTQLLSQRVRLKLRILQAVANCNPEGRITELINCLKKQNNRVCSEDGCLQLTRQQIANMTGLRIETVIRIFRQMHSNGKLLIEKGKIYM